MYTFNYWYLVLIVPAALAWYAQHRVRQVHEQYAKVIPHRSVSGMEAARRLLDHYGLANVAIERTPGHLTDHYNPKTKTLRLSDETANAVSVTALGIVAHEAAHARQDAESYRFMRLRTLLADRFNRIAPWSTAAFIGGMMLRVPILMGLSGVILLGALVFSLITLPVERDASRRALIALRETGLAEVEESAGANQVLRAAALTYLAGLGQRLGTLAFFAVMGLALLKPLGL